jgi:protein-disulfide isomerase
MADSTETRKERRASARVERDRAAAAARARQRQRLWVIGGALAIAVVVVAAIAIASGGGSSTPRRRAGEVIPGQIESNALFNGIPQRGLVLGDPRAPVTMVEFADLQCPYCREYTQQSLSTLVTNYVRTGKVKMIFRNVAFIGPDSLTAARMAAAVAMQNKLWTFIDLFYTNQQEENSGYVTDAFLRRVASGVTGLDVARAMTDRSLPQIQRQLNEAQTQWTTDGFSGTPSFLLGPTGGRLDALNVTALGPGQFSSAIDKALASAPRASS